MDILGALSSFGASEPGVFGLERAIFSLLMAFVCAQLAAWAYVYTHAGLSYSRAFVQSIILLTIIVSLAMMVIGNNIVIAFGLIGALSVIRFRNILKDTRDTAFIFFALIIGMATGTGSYSLALLGTGVFCALLLYLHWSQFGSRHTGDGFVRFHVEEGTQPRGAIQQLLERYCHSTHLVSQRFQEAGQGELSYRLVMRDPARADRLIEEMNALEGISHAVFVLQEDQSEV